MPIHNLAELSQYDSNVHVTSVTIEKRP